jgi:hypothetical protein
VVGCTIGSRGEVPGERKPVINNNNNNNNNNTVKSFEDAVWLEYLWWTLVKIHSRRS